MGRDSEKEPLPSSFSQTRIAVYKTAILLSIIHFHEEFHGAAKDDLLSGEKIIKTTLENTSFIAVHTYFGHTVLLIQHFHSDSLPSLFKDITLTTLLLTYIYSQCSRFPTLGS